MPPSPNPRHEAQSTGNSDGEQCLQVMVHDDVSNPESRRRPPRRCTPALIRIRQLDTIECVSVYGLRARTMIIASASMVHAAALAKRRAAVIVIHQSNKMSCRMRHALRDLTRPSGQSGRAIDRKPSRHCRHSMVPVSNGQA